MGLVGENVKLSCQLPHDNNSSLLALSDIFLANCNAVLWFSIIDMQGSVGCKIIESSTRFTFLANIQP